MGCKFSTEKIRIWLQIVAKSAPHDSLRLPGHHRRHPVLAVADRGRAELPHIPDNTTGVFDDISRYFHEVIAIAVENQSAVAVD